MAKIAVINKSAPAYNLAVHRIATKFKREGHQVYISPSFDFWARDCQSVFFSCIFTWDIPVLIHDVLLAKQSCSHIEVGGPAATAMPSYIIDKTGLQPHLGLDERFEHVMGDDFKMTFSSRGCPRACEFCLVQKVEGRRMIEYSDFPIPVGKNPYLGDNNILATSWEHQKLMVEKLKGVRNLDCNSGFDDRIFIKNPEKYWQLYNELDIEAWRFAYDSPAQRDPVKACADFLHGKGINYRLIIVFCLVGWPGTTLEEARQKLQYLVDIGVSPYPMRYRPLDSVEKKYTPPGWDYREMDILFGYYGVPFHWRKFPWEEYRKQSQEGAKLL